MRRVLSKVFGRLLWQEIGYTIRDRNIKMEIPDYQMPKSFVVTETRQRVQSKYKIDEIYVSSEDFVDGAPTVFATGVSSGDAERIRQALVIAGATVDLKPDVHQFS